MLNLVLTKIIGTRNERELKRISPIVSQIAAFEPAMRALSDAQLAGKTPEFREALAQGRTLDDLLPEAFAVVREAGRRVLNMRHFDVQLIGGMTLHRGTIAEMKTGEGKTLVATLPAYLNALAGKGVHIVTVNDYLAKRDSEWMGRIFRFLGLSVGVIQHALNDAERQQAYAADITYGTNNELGFDYLRDNMKFELSGYVQRGHHFAIVDEVDSILIDEARTPLIISGPADESTDKYYKIDQIIPRLKAGARIAGDRKAEERAELEKTGDYIVDEKGKSVTLTEMGMAHAEQLLGIQNLWEPQNMEVLHHVNQGLRAHTLFQRDVDYVVKDGQVIIVDEFTGRLMPGRRWSDGLHQAVEAKEKVKIERENQTLATITFQNYFRMYKKLCGMTGTAETEAAEFDKIYKLDVLVIPTNRAMIRVEHPDVVFRTETEKFTSVVKEIGELHAAGRPVLVGTISIEKSEHLSELLKREKVRHVVLNAKYHEREAEIVAQAGRFGAVTIATNMAGRGTDIILGGVPDNRAKAVLVEQGLDPETATAEEREAALAQTLGEMDGEFRKELKRVNVDADRPLLAKRYLGLLAAFSTEHPSIAAVTALADGWPTLQAYLEAMKGLSKSVREKVPRGFYPMIEEPQYDFFGDHPLRTQLDAVAASGQMERVIALLDERERERVVALGGLHILATERHEARRIDNQLRGRAGRQGDPGSSRFYLSLQDDLMRIFGSDRISGLLLKMGMEEGVPIEHKMVTRSIARAQKQVEAQNFGTRKHLIEYDDVMNKQRETIYSLRRRILEGSNTREHINDLSSEIVDWYVAEAAPADKDVSTWDLERLSSSLRETFGLDVPAAELEKLPRASMAETLFDAARRRFEAKEQEMGAELMSSFQRYMMLQVVDTQWKDHLYALDHLKEGIHFRAYGQRDPLVEYKKESYQMFEDLTNRIDEDMLRWIYLAQPVVQEPPRPAPQQLQTNRPGDGDEPELVGAGARAAVPAFAQKRAQAPLQYNNPAQEPAGFKSHEPREAQGGIDADVQTVRRDGPKVGRNDPCPCGSGKKYKKCHGA